MAIPSFICMEFEYYLPPFVSEPVYVFGVEIGLLKATYSWVLFFTHPTTLCFLIGKISPLPFRVIIGT